MLIYNIAKLADGRAVALHYTGEYTLQCASVKSDGTTCGRWAPIGFDHCHIHMSKDDRGRYQKGRQV